jgi:hypothetical protein
MIQSIGRFSQAVVVHLRLSDQRVGSSAERFRLDMLEGALGTALAGRNDLVFTGRDIGEGYCSLFFYGHNAAHMYSEVLPLIQRFGPAPGSYVDLTEGLPITPNCRRERVELVAYEPRLDLVG